MSGQDLRCAACRPPEELVEVTTWNDKGKVMLHELYVAPTASESQIADTIQMIEKGSPAWVAAYLATHGEQS